MNTYSIMPAQIVFLIDTNIEECFVDSATSLSNSICLACFRLLHHLSAHFEKRGTVGISKPALISHVKWGYKFFNRKSHQTKIESHKLYDFKLKYFEEFENDVQRRLEHETNSSKDGKSLKPVDSLNRALTELLADFQWESPDIHSPVKGRTFRKQPQERQHMVFLFTKCPKSFILLKEFTGKQVPDDEVFLYSMLPSTLFHQFCKIAKLSLHWIDTQHFTFTKNSELKSLQLIEKAVQKTGGNLVSLDAIVSHGCPYFTDVQCLVDDESTEQEVAQYTSKDSCRLARLLPVATVMKTLFSPQCSNSNPRNTQLYQETTIQIGDKKLQVSLTQGTIETIQDSGPLNNRMKPDSSVTRHEELLFQPRSLQGYAVLGRRSRGCDLSIRCSYICEEDIRKLEGKKKEAFRDGMFEKLLSQLVFRNSILVLICTDSGQLALLEPLTVHTATLSVLCTGTSLSLEKLLLDDEASTFTSPDEVVDGKESCDQLVKRMVSSIQVTKGNDMAESASVNCVDGRLLDRWVIPGSPDTLHTLITKLNQRISELDFLSADEAGVLKQLQQCYKFEKKPPGLRDTAVPNCTNTEFKTDPVDKFELQYKGKASRTSLSRADKILCKSKEMVRESVQSKKGAGEVDTKPDRDRSEITAHLADFGSVDELKSYLVSTYERASTGEVTSIDSTVQTMITVALHYIKQTEDKVIVEESCKNLLEETLLKSGAQLRDKYNQTGELSLRQRIAEYETQVLLRVEIISTLENKDQAEGEEVNDEIVGMLRTLSFISETWLLSKFMESNLVNNYVHTIPRTLANIYDELMQPLPDNLANILSPDHGSTDQSILDDSINGNDKIGGPPSARTRSHGSAGPPSSQPGSNHLVSMDMSMNRSRGSRKLVHHYSMADFGSKRQIVVQKLPVQKKQKSSKKKCKDSQRKAKEKVAKSLFEKVRGGTKLERRQSVAVMQRSYKTPKKNQASKSPRRLTPRRHLVAETPCHKQVSHVLIKASHQRRYSVAMETHMDVVEESPEKSCDTSRKDSPTKGKRAKALLRRAFYSAGPSKRTKNLTQYFQLADRIAGRQRQPSGSKSNKPVKLLSFDAAVQFKSPDKNSSFLLSQLVASPSPAKFTPRKNTNTPNKLVDSPHNTRSKLGTSPVVDLFKSPRSRCRMASPAEHLLQSPMSRRYSPKVLAAESGVKLGPVSMETTPEKSPICGMVTFGLDSPSQNTRQRTSQTPTRKSVRAALFAKSPASTSIRNQSPYRGTASPRTLLDRFGSPTKQVPLKENNVMSPKPTSRFNCKNHDTNTVTHANNSLFKRISPQKKPMSIITSLPSAHCSFTDSCLSQLPSLSNKPSGEHKTLPGSKTPSPHGKKVTKTPDSFDKWHRRKPRLSQNSPSRKKKQTDYEIRVINQHTENDYVNLNQSKATYIVKKLNQSDECTNAIKIETGSPKIKNQFKGILKKKRSLVQSPGGTVESPCKRRRTTVDDSDGACRHGINSTTFSMCSQGFDISGACNELSQVSNASSIDYFSATNDEVFLSQDTEEMDYENIENNSQKTRRISKKRSLLHSFIDKSSPRNKAVERLFSDNIPCLDELDSDRSESPIFGVSSSRRTNRSRMVSGDVTNQSVVDISQVNVLSGADSGHVSPAHIVKSPGTKKFSPNVSAKSLMHLIQSPLVLSPDSGGRKIKGNLSPRRSIVGEHSRRSLKMFN